MRITASVAFCSECARYFKGQRTWDRHRKNGRCLSDTTLKRRGFVKRAGIWRRVGKYTVLPSARPSQNVATATASQNRRPA